MSTRSLITDTLHWLSRVVHESVKRCSQAQWYASTLVTIPQAEWLVPVAEVKCSEESCTYKPTQFVLSIWHRELVLDSEFVNALEVYKESEFGGTRF